MREIGGYFPYIEEPDNKNHYLDGLCPPEGDLRFLMSGRCANYLALEDFKKQQPHPVAYVPLYTCETVIDPFVKAGYELIFYDFTKDMIPIFDESVLDKIHLISICGYYGFSGYDREFLKKCEERGICIIEDTTHSIFSADGIYEGCTYVVGSMRKWLGFLRRLCHQENRQLHSVDSSSPRGPSEHAPSGPGGKDRCLPSSGHRGCLRIRGRLQTSLGCRAASA